MHTPKLRVLYDMFNQLPKYVIVDKISIDEWEFRKGVFKGEDGYEMEDEVTTIHPGDFHYPGYDCAHFFKASVTVPKEWEGKPLRAKFAVGGESLVKCNGKVVAGCTTRDSIPERTEFSLGTAKGGEVLNFDIEATVDSMYFADNGGMDLVPTLETKFVETSIYTIDPEVEGFMYDLMVAFDARNHLSDEHIREKLYAAIDDCLHIVDYDFEPDEVRKSIYEARKFYNQKLSEIKWTPQSNVILTGHSHIDVAWLWRVQESIRKSARTFTNVTTLMDEYPEMTFGQSQAVLYDMTKKHYPEIYEKIKEKVANNQWDICGNVWVEADTNIASGESLIRQVLYGTEYFKKEFGKASKTYWLPDCFGFTAALPQIIKGCGMENFITSKLTNNDTTQFPFNMFMWKGNNGDTIYAHLMKPSYNLNFRVEDILHADNECNNKSELTDSMSMYGYGDGGGGPTREMLERGRRMKNFPGLPTCEIGHVDDFFKTYHGKEKELPVWNGEMYYQNHRGTYTSQAFVKKNNRKGEFLLTRNELLSVLVKEYLGEKYPKEDIEKAWRILMTNQFHDILPGSSIHAVYEDCKKTYGELMSILNGIKSDKIDSFVGSVKADKNSVTVINLSSADNSTEVEVEGVPENLYVDGLPSIHKDGKLVFVPDIKACSVKTFKLIEKSAPAEKNTGVALMENSKIKVTLDENAQITSIYDKVNDREALAGKGNILTISLDKCIHETAWNLEINYKKKMWELKNAESIELVEDNDLRKVIRVVRKFNKSTITQDYILYADADDIVFDTTVDWHETDKVLKAGFEAAVIDTDATYDIAHGTVRRPTHYNTDYDFTRYEVAAHKWADLSEGDYGCSIINDCKYGYDIHDSHIRITLMRAPTCPDRTGDHGINTFRYAFLPHANDWRNVTIKRALSFNIPCWAKYNAQATDGKLASDFSFIEVNKDNLTVEALKEAQDGNGYIIRIAEEKQQRGKATIKLGFDFGKVIETNMIEENKDNVIDVKDNSFSFEFKPFEVKTFRILK